MIDRTTHPNPKRKRFIIFAAAAFAFIIALFIVLLAQVAGTKPAGIADTVRVSLFAYTNSPSGARLALLSITNPSPIAIQVGSYHDVQIETSNGWQSLGNVRASRPTIRPHQAVLFSVQAPSTNQPWRLWLNYRDHADFGQRCLLALKKLGLPISYHSQTYSADSGPMPPFKP